MEKLNEKQQEFYMDNIGLVYFACNKYNLDFSLACIGFCKAILSRSNEFVEVKKACLYVINKYKELRDKKSTILFNTALKNVLNREEKENLNSYMVDEEYKLLKQFD